MIDRMTTDMFTAFALVGLIAGWYKRTSRYHSRASHRLNVARDNQMNKWVGEISDEMRKRIAAKFRGDRIYSLYVGAYHRRSVA